MTDQQTPPSPAEQQKMLEEAKQKFDAAKSQMDRSAGKARDAWNAKIQTLRKEVEEASVILADASAKRDESEAIKDTPAGLEVNARASLVAEIYLQLGRMKEREIAVYQECVTIIDNLGPLDVEPPPAVPRFPSVADDLAYLEARARFHTITLTYHWLRNRLGLEVILRATGNEPAVTGNEVWETEVTQRAETLRNAMQGDKDFMILAGKLGSELNESRALLEWGRGSLRTLGQLPEGPRRKALDDTDWAKVNGALQVVLDAPERSKTFPALEKSFDLG
ncbi:MAG: hypothetical protein JWM80_3783 [Cyanobacteria bacterium RYN_339]|nr:hypothetical protein [Cyanobacteria bacterium RYN_339]